MVKIANLWRFVQVSLIYRSETFSWAFPRVNSHAAKSKDVGVSSFPSSLSLVAIQDGLTLLFPSSHGLLSYRPHPSIFLPSFFLFIFFCRGTGQIHVEIKVPSAENSTLSKISAPLPPSQPPPTPPGTPLIPHSPLSHVLMCLSPTLSLLVRWCFEPSQPQRITSGLNTNFTLSPSY